MSVKGSRTYDGRSVDDRRAGRRAAFLAAGLALFGGGGYANTSVTALCREAGLARNQFYEHFNCREDLLLAVYDMIQIDARAAVSAAMPSSSVDRGLADRLGPGLQAYAESIGADPHRATVSFIEIVGVSARVEAHRVEQREIWVQFVIEELRQQGIDPPGGYVAAATGLIGALMALVQRWCTTEPKTDLSAATTVLTHFLLGLTL